VIEKFRIQEIRKEAYGKIDDLTDLYPHEATAINNMVPDQSAS
jgi:hypothetical protein